MVTLSVLDQTPIFRGSTAAETIHETIELAKEADRLGYRRFWVAEHHSEITTACASPEILIAAIAANTTRIRVGSGGVMLPNTSALKVAETFRMLQTLFPGRIDLGVGRGPGATPKALMALRGLREVQNTYNPIQQDQDNYPQQLKDLLGFLTNSLSSDHPYKGVIAMPDSAGTPEAWFLGASESSPSMAASLGMSFCFAQFFRPALFPHLFEVYRRSFRPSMLLDKPSTSLALRVICADTEEEAFHLASSFWLMYLSLHGQDVPSPFKDGIPRFPSIEDVDNYHFTDENLAFMRGQHLMMIASDPEGVRARLMELAAVYGVDEFIIANACPTFKTRVRSYQLLAEAFQLAPISPYR